MGVVISFYAQCVCKRKISSANYNVIIRSYLTSVPDPEERGERGVIITTIVYESCLFSA